MKSPLTIYYSHKGLQPPVYVAGSWTNPPWQPQEMNVSDTKTDDGELRFVKHFDAIDEGEYQYKFRLGPGDWWVTDDNAVTATDSSGNKNNLVIVKGERPTEENKGTASSEPGNEAKTTVSAPIEEDTHANASSAISPSTSSEPKDSTVENETKTASPVLDKSDTAPLKGDNQALEDAATPESAPIPFTVVETVRETEPPVFGDIETERLEEDPSKRTEDVQPDVEYQAPPTAAPPSPSSVKSPKDITIPQLIVEKTDDTLRHGDDFGPKATSGQKLAHSLHKADAQPDEVLISPPASPTMPNRFANDESKVVSPEVVKDSESDPAAPLLPHERLAEAEEDAGEALEVPLFSHECTFEDGDDEAIQRIPSMERVRIEGGVPLFPHETAAIEEPGSPGLSMPRNRSVTSLRSMRSLKSAELDEDPNDPSVEPFPTNREEIYEHIRRTENRLPEDDSIYQTELPPTLNGELSPAVVSLGAPSSVGPGSPLRPITEDDQDAEDNDVEEAPLPAPIGSLAELRSQSNVSPSQNTEPSTVREQTPDEERNLDAPPTPPLTPKEKGRQTRPEPIMEAVVTEPGSSDPVASSSRENTSEEVQPPHTWAKAEGVRQRKASPEPPLQSVIATSQSGPPATKSEGGFLSAFWRVFFGSWLGPLGHWLASLLGSKRNTVLSFTILVAVGASGAAYYLSTPVS